MENQTSLSVTDYEHIADSFLTTAIALTSAPIQEPYQELSQILEHLLTTLHQLDLYNLSEDQPVLISIPYQPQTILEKLTQQNNQNLTKLALLGIIVQILNQMIPQVICQTIQYQLNLIAKELAPNILTSKNEVTFLYITKIFIIITQEYWNEFINLNPQLQIKNNNNQKISYPPIEKYITTAYTAGYAFAYALVKYYLNQKLV